MVLTSFILFLKSDDKKLLKCIFLFINKVYDIFNQLSVILAYFPLFEDINNSCYI